MVCQHVYLALLEAFSTPLRHDGASPTASPLALDPSSAENLRHITERTRECAAHTALMGDGVAMATMRRNKGSPRRAASPCTRVKSSVDCMVKIRFNDELLPDDPLVTTLRGGTRRREGFEEPAIRDVRLSVLQSPASDGARARTEQPAAESASGSLSRCRGFPPFERLSCRFKR